MLIRIVLALCTLGLLSSCMRPTPINDVPMVGRSQVKDCEFIGMTQGYSHGFTLSWSVDRMIAANQMRDDAEERGGNAILVEWLCMQGGQARIYLCPPEWMPDSDH